VLRGMNVRRRFRSARGTFARFTSRCSLLDQPTAQALGLFAGGWKTVFLLAAVYLVSFVGELRATEPPPRTGVTILVHGLVLLDGETKDPVKYWGAENVASLLRRYERGLVWLYNPDTRRFDNISNAMDGDGNFLIPHAGWNRDLTGEQVLLFDWGAGSGEKEAGQAEAAADELFSALLAFEVDNQPIISLVPPIAVALRPMHFIGHSRGTVVTSETVQRLGRYNVPVSYVTYLDPHDFGQPDITRDEFFHDPAVQVWHNVDHADCFYQKSEVECINPHGRPLAHLVGLAGLQRDLTNLALFDQCDRAFSPHARVKDYYWTTVACNAGDEASRPRSWFPGNGNGSGHGFDRWFGNGGYEQSREEGIRRINAGTPGAALAFHLNNDPDNDKGEPDRNDVPPVIFNGDFDLPDLDGSVGGALQAGTLAGWWYYGGGGEGTIRANRGNHALELERGKFERSPVVATHNRFYLPRTGTEIRFAYWGKSVPPTGDHTLDVMIGNRIIRSFTVGETSGFEVRTASLDDHDDLRGGSNTLTFRMNTNNPPAQSAVVRLDNISIFENRTVSRFTSIRRGTEGEFVLDWQSWPPRSYQLEAALNGLKGLWTEIGDPMERASSGPTVVEHPGVPSAFFRLRLVP
jgi:hypothetical protein